MVHFTLNSINGSKLNSSGWYCLWYCFLQNIRKEIKLDYINSVLPGYIKQFNLKGNRSKVIFTKNNFI